MANEFRQRMAEAAKLNRNTISDVQRQIAGLYEQAAEDLARITGEATSPITRQWADTYSREMKGRVRELWHQVSDITKGNMLTAAQRAVGVQVDLLSEAGNLAGLDLRNQFASTFARTPDEAVASVIQGGLYKGPRAGLSRRIWNNAALQSGDIEQMILQGLAKQQSPVQLAKALEAYVNPAAAAPDLWNDVYENTPFPLKVDYNAKRLATAAINHAHYSGTMMAAHNNPYAEYLHWELSAMHIYCGECEGYAAHDEGLGIGNFSLESAPAVPHPWCMCLWYVDSSKSLADIGRELYRWEQGESNPALDQAFGKWMEVS